MKRRARWSWRHSVLGGALLAVAGLAQVSPHAQAVASWPQTGGPNRDFIVASGPRLADTWPAFTRRNAKTHGRGNCSLREPQQRVRDRKTGSVGMHDYRVELELRDVARSLRLSRDEVRELRDEL